MLKTDKLWTPSVDFGSLQSSVFIGFEREDRSDWDFFLYQYSTLWYNSCIALMMVEINARTSTQISIACFIYILNAVINAVLFGVFVDQFMIIRQKQAQQ